MNSDLLEILCCPETHQGVQLAEPGMIEKLNALIENGQLENRAGQPVQQRIDAGLIRTDRRFLYPIRQDIPILLVDEAIPLPSRS